MKNYQLFIGLSFLIIGILIFSFLSDPIRFGGFFFIIGAAIYFILSSTPKQNDRPEDKYFRSRTRDQILKHKHRVR